MSPGANGCRERSGTSADWVSRAHMSYSAFDFPKGFENDCSSLRRRMFLSERRLPEGSGHGAAADVGRRRPTLPPDRVCASPRHGMTPPKSLPPVSLRFPSVSPVECPLRDVLPVFPLPPIVHSSVRCIGRHLCLMRGHRLDAHYLPRGLT